MVFEDFLKKYYALDLISLNQAQSQEASRSKHLIGDRYCVRQNESFWDVKIYELFDGISLTYSFVKGKTTFYPLLYKNHNIFSINYILSGDYGVVFKNDELKIFNANTLVASNLSFDLKDSFPKSGFCENIGIIIDESLASKEIAHILKRVNLSSINEKIYQNPYMGYPSKSISQIFTEMRNHFDLGSDYLRIKFLEFIVLFNKQLGQKSSSQEFYIAQKVKDYIVAHYDKDISISKICDLFDVSDSKLQRDFSLCYGTSVYQYVKSERIRQAMYLLSSNENSIGEIVRQVGYTNESKFCESFKKATGKTPREFKKNLIR